MFLGLCYPTFGHNIIYGRPTGSPSSSGGSLSLASLLQQHSSSYRLRGWHILGGFICFIRNNKTSPASPQAAVAVGLEEG